MNKRGSPDKVKNPGPEDGEQKTAGSRQDSGIRELVKEVRSQRSEVKKQPVTNNIPYCSPFTVHHLRVLRLLRLQRSNQSQIQQT